MAEIGSGGGSCHRLLSGRQMEFLLGEDRRINLLVGSVRSGKTWISLLKWALFVAESPEGSQFLMAGKTMGTLNRNCLTLLLELVGSDYFSYSQHLKQGVLFGRVVWFEDANDVTSEQKLRGLTLAGAYLDELTLLREDFYRMLLSRLSAAGARLFATTNPDGPKSWVYREIITNGDLDKRIWEFYIDDNPFLPEEYVTNIKREYSGVFYDRFILGRWVAGEGLIYRQFADCTESFYAGKRDFDFEYVNIGVDFGGNKSGHAFVACGVTVLGEVVVLGSERHFGQEIDPLCLYRLIESFIERIREKHGWVSNVWCDCAEPVLIRGLRNYLGGNGPAVRPVKKQRIMDRIRATMTLLASGRLLYTDGCETFVEAMCSALWNGKEDNLRLDDGYLDVDTLDAFEYGAATALARV